MTKTQNLKFMKTDIEITPLEAPNVGWPYFKSHFCISQLTLIPTPHLREIQDKVLSVL